MSPRLPRLARTPRWLQGLLLGVLVLLAVAFLSGLFTRRTPPGRAAQPAADNAAAASHSDTPRTLTVQPTPLPRTAVAAGSIEARHEISLASRIAARVERIPVIAGQSVHAGDLLVELDQTDLAARVKQAQANLDAAHSQLQQARSDLAKLTELRQQGAATERELQDAQRRADVAASGVQAAEQALADAQSQLQYTRLTAPMDAIVVDKRVNDGDLASPGQELIRLYDPHRLQLVAAVPESLATNLKPGDEVGVEIDALSLRCTANISEIVPQSAPGSRSMLVKVTGPCPPGATTGMFGRMILPLGQEQVLLVPRSAVERVGQLAYLHVLSGDPPAPQRRLVRLGRTHDDQFEILAGLSLGETILLHPVD